MDVVGAGHFDDRVHPRDGFIVDPQVGRSELPDLDHVLVEDLFADQLVPFEDLELEGDLDVGHWCSPVSFVVSRFGRIGGTAPDLGSGPGSLSDALGTSLDRMTFTRAPGSAPERVT